MKDTILNFPDYPAYREGKNLTNNPKCCCVAITVSYESGQVIRSDANFLSRKMMWSPLSFLQ